MQDEYVSDKRVVVYGVIVHGVKPAEAGKKTFGLCLAGLGLSLWYWLVGPVVDVEWTSGRKDERLSLPQTIRNRWLWNGTYIADDCQLPWFDFRKRIVSGEIHIEVQNFVMRYPVAH